ncbi:MAG TPA: hypothetical protein VHM24_07685, partial [Gemmatimonadaceae bacterium]|nr:hypothetical protein [Gemmatimonadaceae bacterium]
QSPCPCFSLSTLVKSSDKFGISAWLTAEKPKYLPRGARFPRVQMHKSLDGRERTETSSSTTIFTAEGTEAAEKCHGTAAGRRGIGADHNSYGFVLQKRLQFSAVKIRKLPAG